MAAANLEAAFDFLEFLTDNPDAIANIPDGATVVLPTGDNWVDAQNERLAEQVGAAGETVYRPAIARG